VLRQYGPGKVGVIQECRLPASVSKAVAAFAAAQGAENAALVAYSGDRILCSARSSWTDLLVKYRDSTPEAVAGGWDAIADGEPVHKLILLAPPDAIEALRPQLAALLGDSADLTQAVPEMLEVLPKGASKGKGVACLLAHLGVTEGKGGAVAVGDAENDIGMLSLPGVLSVAMGQAPPSVQAAARFLTASNTEDGAAAVFESVLADQARRREQAPRSGLTLGRLGRSLLLGRGFTRA
jgi:hydroxymethylpyrimidine pyrophosphatase-like HAD family hydrolase